MSNTWQRVHGVITPGGDPCWVCPKCGKDEHVCGIETEYNRHHVCKKCGAILRYPDDDQGDLIDRKLAIEAIHEEYDEWLVVDKSGDWIADNIESILDRMPKVKLDDKDSPLPDYDITKAWSGVDYDIEKYQMLTNNACKYCSNNPENGGSGICNCTLGSACKY